MHFISMCKLHITLDDFILYCDTKIREDADVGFGRVEGHCVDGGLPEHQEGQVVGGGRVLRRRPREQAHVPLVRPAEDPPALDEGQREGARAPGVGPLRGHRGPHGAPRRRLHRPHALVRHHAGVGQAPAVVEELQPVDLDLP